jgi:hypothetical protein
LASLLLHVSKLTLPPSHDAALAASPKEGERARITAFGADTDAARMARRVNEALEVGLTGVIGRRW